MCAKRKPIPTDTTWLGPWSRWSASPAMRKFHALDRYLIVPTICMNLHFWFHCSWVYNPDHSAMASANIEPDNTSGLHEPDVAEGPIDLLLTRDAHPRINRFVISSCSSIARQVRLLNNRRLPCSISDHIWKGDTCWEHSNSSTALYTVH